MPDLTETSVVVTGGAGFIGSHLVERLLVEGATELVVIDDLSTGTSGNLAGLPVQLVEGDIRDGAIAKRCGDADLVFHLAVRNVRASIERPAENFAVNADGALQVLEAMRHGKRGRFVYVSSSEVYGIPEGLDFSETTLPAPTTVYGAGKLAGEHITLAYHRTYGMDTRVIRPFNNYGPRSHFEGDSGEVIPKFILRALVGRPLLIHGDGTQTRDFMFVRDTAHWLPRLAGITELAGSVVNIGTGVETSVNELASAILSFTGSSSEVQHHDARPGDLPRLQANVAKISSLTDFELPTGFDKGLRETIDFFAQQDVEELLRQEQERNWT